jgi:hypothetical protein
MCRTEGVLHALRSRNVVFLTVQSRCRPGYRRSDWPRAEDKRLLAYRGRSAVKHSQLLYRREDVR